MEELILTALCFLFLCCLWDQVCYTLETVKEIIILPFRIVKWVIRYYETKHRLAGS